MLVDLVRRLCGRQTPAASRPVAEPLLPWLPAPEPAPAPQERRGQVASAPGRSPECPDNWAHRRTGPVPVAAATPRRRRRRAEPGALSPAMHARRLLHWCQTDGGVTGAILARDLADSYHHMCAWDGLEPYAWQTVAAALRPLTGGRKTYQWVDGGSHRLRVYHIPSLPPGSDTTFLALTDWLARETAPEPVRLRRAA